MRKRISLLIAALMLALTMSFGSVAAFAKITEEPVACENPSGAEPGGQQPECKNQNLNQIEENQNPTGKAPPGQNK